MSQKRSNTIFLVIKHPVKSYKNLQIEKLPSFAFQKTKQTNNVANHEALSIRTKKKKKISMWYQKKGTTTDYALSLMP